MNAKVLGIAYHLPERIETNEDLARENPDWRMDEIRTKVGIASRHIAAPQETASDLGFQAAANLLARNLVPKNEIDFLLFCTEAPDHYLPPASCVLQQRLALSKTIGAFDFNLACSGYVYGLYVSKALIESGLARNVLLINADTYSKYIHPRDRTVRTLFGDGAAATLIGRSSSGSRIGEFVLGTDGEGADKLIVPAGCFRLPRSSHTSEEKTDETDCTRSLNNLYMDGKALFAFALSRVPEAISAITKKASLTIEQVDWFVYHQANKMMLETLARVSSIPSNKMIYSLEDIGNTVSASIPIAIQRYVEQGKITSGQTLLLVGFGVGFSWGACNLVWD